MEDRFPRYRFACPCCNENNMDDMVLHLLEIAGGLFETAIRSNNVTYTVTSGFRCKKHNAEVGGAKHSLHMLGLAADTIPIVEGKSEQEILRWWFFSLISAGFTGVGLTRGNAIHADIRAGEGLLPQVWAPQKNGKGYYYLLP